MKRLFIETEDLDQSEYRRAQRRVTKLLDGENLPDDVFDEVASNAWHKAAEAWEAVKRADEIYADSLLVSASGYFAYDGAPLVFNTMMAKAVEENITGKSLIFLRELDDLEWDNIDLDLLEKVFTTNKMFTLWENELQEVDVPVLLIGLR